MTDPKVARRLPGHPPDLGAVPRLNEMNAHGQYVALAYYESGLKHGYAAGYDDCEAEVNAQQAHAASLSRMVAMRPSYADLCERRGEHERAERQRAILRERGISLPGVAS